MTVNATIADNNETRFDSDGAFADGEVIVSKHPLLRSAYQLRAQVLVPRRRDIVFGFFSDPSNLERITPPWLNFHILGEPPTEIREGARIDYRLGLRGISVNWRSLISCWRPPCEFVDEQVRGPYRLWRHLHVFEEESGGTLVRDVVDYQVPGGWLTNGLFVQRDLEKIFRFRQRKIIELLAESTLSE